MSNDPDGFEDNPQAQLSDDDDTIIDESIWGPQRVLTAEEQASYDAWFLKKVEKSLQKIKDGTAEFRPHEEVMAEMKAYLDQLDREAGIRDN